MTILNPKGIAERAKQVKMFEENENKAKRDRLDKCLEKFGGRNQDLVNILDTVDECKRQGFNVIKPVSGNPISVCGDYIVMKGVNYDSHEIRYYPRSKEIKVYLAFDGHSSFIYSLKEELSDIKVDYFFSTHFLRVFDKIDGKEIPMIEGIEKMLLYLDGYVDSMVEYLTNDL